MPFMANNSRGRWIRLTPARKMVVEILHHARKVPSLTDARHCNILPVLQARQGLPDAPSWTAIFMRAYALTGQKFPELRRAFLPWPIKHLYEHFQSDAVIPVEREWKGEQCVFTAKLRGPERKPLMEIQAYLRHLKTAPVWEINYFRKILRVGRYPGWLRRFLFWATLNWSGANRARNMGTFIIASMGTLGVEQIHPLTPLTTYLTFGPISADGHVEVKVIYDHRVMDARVVARVLNELEQMMNGRMVEELGELKIKQDPGIAIPGL